MDIRPIRRVVTGHDGQGRAVVVMDGPAGAVLHRPSRPGVALTDLWATSDPPSARPGGDPVDRPVVLHPPSGGTVFRIVQFDPEDPGALARADSQRASSRSVRLTRAHGGKVYQPGQAPVARRPARVAITGRAGHVWVGRGVRSAAAIRSLTISG